MKKLILFLAAALTASAALAVLGETIEQSNKRYNGGKPGTPSAEDLKTPLLVGPGASNLFYIANGFNIRVGFEHGKTQVMLYKHSGNSKMTEAEMNKILEENYDEGPWTPLVPTPAQRKSPTVQSYIRQCDGKILVRPDQSIAYTMGHQRAVILVYRALAK